MIVCRLLDLALLSQHLYLQPHVRKSCGDVLDLTEHKAQCINRATEYD